MRVVILSFSHVLERRGGAENQCDIISRELYKLGFDVSYIFVSDECNTSIYKGVKLFPIKRKNKIIPGKNHYQYFIPVLKKLKQIKPEVIYIRNLNALIGIAAFFKIFNKTKIALHIASAADLNKLKYKLISPYFLSLLFNNLLKKIGINLTDIIFGQEKWHIDRFKELYGEKNFSFLRVNKLYELKLSTDAKRDDNHKNIVWIGNIKPVKRIDLLFDLAEEIANEKVVINVIGRIDYNGLERKDYLKKLNSYDNIKYHGNLEYNTVLKILSEAHCLVHTSDYEGGAPMVFLESWSLFTPVISLNINPDNIFKNFENCFSDGNFNDFVEDVKKMLFNNELRVKNGEIGNEIVKNSFSTNNIHDMISFFRP
jgi:glycosyltransferase involved in cell wall biosynthesis